MRLELSLFLFSWNWLYVGSADSVVESADGAFERGIKRACVNNQLFVHVKCVQVHAQFPNRRSVSRYHH
jgi:hypothetical protein